MKQTILDKFQYLKNDRGVALIIVLLVTALLIALVFEFAYSTRVSMHASQNFRDSQRAYFLARSGINYLLQTVDLKNPHCPNEIPSFGTAESVSFICEDESGKINLKDMLKTEARYNWASTLFGKFGINTDALDRIISPENPKIQFLSDLHKYLNDEEYHKIAVFLTVNSITGTQLNVNTASETVLQCAFSASDVTDILSRRQEQAIENKWGTDFTAESKALRIYSNARVGGYAKQIEVITDGKQFSYWKSL